MSKLPLTLACWNYDRTAALSDGRVTAEGIDLNVLTLDVEETFFRMLRHREFDAAEMSLSSYCVGLGRGSTDFIALPVFPSRFFRHSCRRNRPSKRPPIWSASASACPNTR